MVRDKMSTESPETTSTSVVEEIVNISFEDIVYTTSRGVFKRGRKTILDGVCGSFNGGELSVIMGQSGAGKSTLMDILAGYTKPESGRIFVNGRVRDEKWFHRRSCYIMQSDHVQEMLTVEEALQVAADLKLGDHVSKEMKQRRVEEILLALGLKRSRKTRAKNLSGGQKKRLAIGLELVNDPPVMFLDEPTSGLDYSMTKQLIYLLRLLARQGRTVVITIHQPSSLLLQMVDRIYGMVAGQCAYMGSVSLLVPFLDEMTLKCPPHHNPVDFFIEICADNSISLVSASDNGRNTEWISNIAVDENQLLLGPLNVDLSEDVALTSLPPPKEDETSKILLKLKSTYSTSPLKQFNVLTRRTFKIFWRNPTFARNLIVIHCGVALFIGLLFYNIGEDAKYFRDNYNFMYFSLMFLMYTAFSISSITFPQELPVIRREHFNRWYTTGAYYSSTVAAVLPIQVLCAFIYTCVSYWMTGQPPHLLRFLGFSWMLILVSFLSLLLGLLNGSFFDVTNAVVFGPFLIMPFTVFSGFFLSYADAPHYFKWLFNISFLKHGLVGLMLSIFGLNRPTLPCSALYCHYAYPKKFLDEQGCTKETYGFAVLMLFVLKGIIVITTYVVLKIRMKRKW